MVILEDGRERIYVVETLKQCRSSGDGAVSNGMDHMQAVHPGFQRNMKYTWWMFPVSIFIHWRGIPSLAAGFSSCPPVASLCLVVWFIDFIFAA